MLAFARRVPFGVAGIATLARNQKIYMYANKLQYLPKVFFYAAPPNAKGSLSNSIKEFIKQALAQ